MTTTERLIELLHRVWLDRAQLPMALQMDIAVELRRDRKQMICFGVEQCTHDHCLHRTVHAWDERCDEVCHVQEGRSLRCLPEEKESK